MQMDPRLNCEYERAYPRTQPYSRLPYDKRAEKAWWADYYRRNPTLLMRWPGGSRPRSDAAIPLRTKI